MADFFETNSGTVIGTGGEDRLTFTYSAATNDVWLTNLSGSFIGGYSGKFDGMGGNDCYFTGIEHFSFFDLSGGNDIINTGDGNDVLSGGAGDDALGGAGGVDTIIGGAGNDYWTGNLGTAAVNIAIDLNGTSAFLGTGSVTETEGMNLTTGSGNDSFVTHRTAAMNDVITSGAGADRILVYGGGTDSANGGDGNDRLTLIYETASNDVHLTDLTSDVGGGYSGKFDGQGGNNLYFTGIEQFTFIDRAGGNDIINTGGGDDVLNGGGGADILNGGGGIDKIDGGAGKDTWGGDLSTASEIIAINLNGASSFLGDGQVTRIEAMNLKTGSGNDVLKGHQTSGLGDTIASGDGGDDITLYNGGTDSVDGGAGSDTLNVVCAIASNDIYLTNLTEDAEGGYSGKFDGQGGNDIYFSHIETFTFVDRWGGNDIINTGKGNDVLSGGGGDDSLLGGQGIDRIDGGVGNDRWGGDLSFTNENISINVNGGSTFLGSGSVRNIEALNLITGGGNDTVKGHVSSAMSDSIATGGGNDAVTLFLNSTDWVDGGAGKDTLTVNNTADTGGVWLMNLTLNAGGGYDGKFDGTGGLDIYFTGIERFVFADTAGGADIINAGDLGDSLLGGGGNDQLSGGGGADKIFGDAGLDTITGGAGKDRLSGGDEADVFVYDRTADEARDTILDFADGVDKIRIAGGSMIGVTIAASGLSDTLVSLSSGTDILLKGVAAGIGGEDFLFV